MEQTVIVQTGLGQVTVQWSDGQLLGIHLGPPASHADFHCSAAVAGEAPDAEGEALVRSLVDYFSGVPAAFPEPPMEGGTPFQQAVWQAARGIPCGETRSYGWVAGAVGQRPGAARAVGAALGKNPFPLVVPCHRVVGTTGKLTGFTGGIEWKAALLAFERSRFPVSGSQLVVDFGVGRPGSGL